MALALASGLFTASICAAEPADSGARQLVAAIERRASATSFAALERFGEAASRQPGREGLRRLHHVAVIMLGQSEFGRFEHWNGLLAARAAQEGDARYAEVARLDALKSQYDRGDTSVEKKIAAVAGSEPDWYARAHAVATEAQMLTNRRESGAALKLAFEARSLIPRDDPDAASAQADLSRAIGLALIQLNDLEGAATAFDRADFDWANGAYPRPDFDDVYNMAVLSARLGRIDLARDMAAAHHRLVARSDLPHLGVWDKYLCAVVAEAAGAPAEVTGCFAGLDANLTGAEFLAPQLLGMRAVAEARQGAVEAAKADLARLAALQASKKFGAAAFTRMPEVRGELLAAEGHEGQAIALLRDYDLQRAELQARRSSAGVSQVTTELQKQLQSVQSEAALEKKVVRSQRWAGGLAALLVMLAVAAMIWQRRSARGLKAARQHAEAASRSKSEFLTNMSHEIRTPLNGVVAVADMLAASGLPERERKMAEIIRSSGQSLERLLSDVLDLARVEAGQLTIEIAPFHAADLVRAVAELIRLRADEKGLALSTEVDPALERWFSGDAVRVRQILTNFASNAVKFTERGSVIIRAEPASPGGLRFSVIDTGVGFSDEVKTRLFARFQQADGSITRRFGGTGLGLAISRQLASLMNGQVDCESAPDHGSRFWFEAAFPEAPAPQLDPAPAGEEVIAQGRPLRVLVADDHATNQLVVRMMLEQFGIEVEVVDDGAQAFEAVKRERFDALLMDMQMPVMDGLAATRMIRRVEAATGCARTPILMLSANALAEHRDAGLAAGADGHVAKPTTVAGLMGALNALLDPAEDDDVEAAAGQAG